MPVTGDGWIEMPIRMRAQPSTSYYFVFFETGGCSIYGEAGSDLYVVANQGAQLTFPTPTPTLAGAMHTSSQMSLYVSYLASAPAVTATPIQPTPTSTLQQLQATVAPSFSEIYKGHTETFTVTSTGGSPPCTYSWSLNGSTAGSGSSYTTSANLAVGTYIVQAKATDAQGTQAVSTATLHVAAVILPSPAPTASGNKASLAIAVSGEGTTDPAPGTHEYPKDQRATLIAQPSDGYDFDGWVFSDGTQKADTEITLTMTQSYSVTALFSQAGPKPTVAPSSGGLFFNFTVLLVVALELVGAVGLFIAPKKKKP